MGRSLAVCAPIQEERDMEDENTGQTRVTGSGPHDEQGKAGHAAAAQPVTVPGTTDKSASPGRTTGEEQAAINREVDPPA
jgi:hypothetical protein